jgi:hypothetical protein
VTLPGAGSGHDRREEVVEFGEHHSARWRWGVRALVACLVLAVLVTAAVRVAGHRARPAAKAAASPPAVRVIAAGHRLLGVTAGWQLFARGPDDLLRIQLAQGRVARTYVPPLDSGNPTVALVVGARDAIIRSSDFVPGYVVPDGHQARILAGPLAGGGPLAPGPPGTRTAWVTAGPPTSPELSLVTLTGHRTGPVIHFPPGGPQVAATAVPDGRGDVLVTTDNSATYDAGPGWDRPVPGAVVAVGPADWLVVTCDPQYRRCRNEVIGIRDGSRRVLPGPADPEAYYSWPPTGIIAPDGSTAAVASPGPSGALTAHLIDLRTGQTTDLRIPLSADTIGLPSGSGPSSQSMTWSPDSRWLFIAASGGRLVAVSARTGRAESLGITLPAVEQVAIRG